MSKAYHQSVSCIYVGPLDYGLTRNAMASCNIATKDVGVKRKGERASSAWRESQRVSSIDFREGCDKLNAIARDGSSSHKLLLPLRTTLSGILAAYPEMSPSSPADPHTELAANDGAIATQDAELDTKEMDELIDTYAQFEEKSPISKQSPGHHISALHSEITVQEEKLTIGADNESLESDLNVILSSRASNRIPSVPGVLDPYAKGTDAEITPNGKLAPNDPPSQEPNGWSKLRQIVHRTGVQDAKSFHMSLKKRLVESTLLLLPLLSALLLILATCLPNEWWRVRLSIGRVITESKALLLLGLTGHCWINKEE